MKTRIIARYETVGHNMYPEDTWEVEREISNEREMYFFIKSIHKNDARHFNNYPLNGGCSKNGFTFYSEKFEILDGEIFINPNRIKTTYPDYFEKCFEDYSNLIKRAAKTIPALRKLREFREKNDEEKIMYKKLKLKYN